MERHTTSLGFSLNHIPPEDLHSIWPVVLPGLQKVRKRSAGSWLPEDVYANLRAKLSILHVGYIEGEYAGFVVLTPVQAWDGMELHVWACYTELPKTIEALFEQVERMARSAGSKRMTFWSKRKWDRRIKKFGFEPQQTQFMKEL